MSSRIAKTVIACVVSVGLAALSATAGATEITYSVSDAGASATTAGAETWQFAFSVANDSLGTSIFNFNINFDYLTISNINPISQPADFDGPLVGLPITDAPFQADGFINYYALDAGIAAGATADGFVADVDVSGARAPVAPTFQILDADFGVIDSGTASSGQSSTSVPEPASLALIGVGLMALGLRRKTAIRR